MKTPSKKAVLGLVLAVPFLAGGAVFATGNNHDYQRKDVCSNVEGFQWKVPEGYYEKYGKCYKKEVKDVCKNVEGNQETVPEGYTEEKGVCTEVPKETPKEETPAPVVETPKVEAAAPVVEEQPAPQEEPVEQSWGK